MANASLRRQLLRLDRLDTALRTAWVATEMKHVTLEAKVDSLTAHAQLWLEEVIRLHGWPGRTLVGPRAADAACRLVQHVKDDVPFQSTCLRHIRRAAKAGDVPLRQVAYVTDAVRVSAGRAQVYGTKFRKRRGKLVPCPIEREATVNLRRARLGMETLEVYAERVRQVFSSP